MLAQFCMADITPRVDDVMVAAPLLNPTMTPFIIGQPWPAFHPGGRLVDRSGKQVTLKRRWLLVGSKKTSKECCQGLGAAAVFNDPHYRPKRPAAF